MENINLEKATTTEEINNSTKVPLSAKSKKSFVTISIVIIFIIIITGIYFIIKSDNKKIANQYAFNSNNTAKSTLTIAPTTFQNISPNTFFIQLSPPTSATKWSQPQPDSITLNFQTTKGNFKQIIVQGYSSTASAAFTLDDTNSYSKMWETLSSYPSKIKQTWKLDSNNAASGANGELLSYVEKSGNIQQVIQYSFLESFKNFTPQLPECPCSYTSTVFLSKPFPVAY